MSRNLRQMPDFRGGLCLAAMLTLGCAADSSAGERVPLAAHRAVYDLELAATRGKQSMESAHGRILYDFSGSACEGYRLNFRQVTQLDSGEGKRVLSDLRTTNRENHEGTRFDFATQNFMDGREVDNTAGRAERDGDNITITLTKPAAKKFTTANAVFPSDHMQRIILAARAGQRLLEVGTYDGAENGEKVYNSLTVIGQAIAAPAPSDAPQAQQALSKLTRWPVTISYFDRGKGGGDQTPAYAISFELYENGVASGVKLDYGDFVLDGKLTTLELKETKGCP